MKNYNVQPWIETEGMNNSNKSNRGMMHKQDSKFTNPLDSSGFKHGIEKRTNPSMELIMLKPTRNRNTTKTSRISKTSNYSLPENPIEFYIS